MTRHRAKQQVQNNLCLQKRDLVPRKPCEKSVQDVLASIIHLERHGPNLDEPSSRDVPGFRIPNQEPTSDLDEFDPGLLCSSLAWEAQP